MPRRRRLPRALLALPLAVLLASCTTTGGAQPVATQVTGSPAAASGSATGTPSTSSSSPTPSTPSETPAASGSATNPAAAPKRSATALEKALLELDDLPPGFSIEPQDEADAGVSVVSSKKPGCAPLVRIMNADSAPGSRVGARTSFSGGQDGPWIDEYLDAMGSAQNVSSLHDTIRAAVKACPKLTMRLPDGRSTMVVREVRAPEAGDDTFAFRVTADGGDLDGFEATQVVSAVGDVELTMLFFGAYPEEIDDGTHAAYEKATELLDHSAPGSAT